MMAFARIASVFLLSSCVALGASYSFAQTSPSDREAAAAAQAKRQGKLPTQGDEQYQKNALKRCERQPEGTARDACVKRVTGAGDTTTRGSVQGGGQVRTNTMQVPPADAPKN
ncbi:hypothetical protein [Variovorax sp. Sphag1AA]|uniref:hypothetical protein n=1 Tax=Variovorax sp. Sphag1AA TaxID=2587027 RepID=UPI001611AAF1|nr:hypothetical protein [Variovorax sp. Sphag1AA]MBB3178620.1 hypothetical protein [Variovorax sp. Sphag1AA]